MNTRTDKTSRGYRLALLLAMGLGSLASIAQAVDPPPLKQGASVGEILDALKIRGDTLKDFTADVTMTSTDPINQLSTAQIGQIWFEGNPKTGGRVRVNFDKDKIGDNTTVLKHQYILGGPDLLNGQDLIDIDFKKQRIDKKQVGRPGDPVNLMKLGEGPFPLPIGQEPAAVQRDFTVATLATAKDDPANTVHVTLTPKEGTPLARKFGSIGVFVDCATDMPVRIVTVDPDGAEIHTTQLDKIAINKGLKADAFAIPPEAKDFETFDGAFHG
jgi:outer membrane lipoprotein-sorting protein